MDALASVARLVLFLGRAIAAVLVVGILLVLFEANEGNTLVDAVLDVGRFFADPFRGIFTLDDNKAQVALNWGIAAAVYLAAAALVAAGVLRAATRPARRSGG